MNSLVNAGEFQTVKKPYPGKYEGAAAPSLIIRRGGFAAPRAGIAAACGGYRRENKRRNAAEGRAIFRLLPETRASRGEQHGAIAPMRHRAQQAVAALCDNAEL